MGELFWNKVAAVVIGLVLMVMVIGVVTDVVFSEGGHGDEHAELAYPIDLEAVLGGAGGSGPAEEEVYDLGLLLANADASAGERTFRRCAACHTNESGGANGTGPNLWNVVGADIATHAGFSYSGAMSEREGNWTFENLDGFLANPRGWLPGTGMSFAGIRGDEDRADLLAYLQTLSDNPVPFPAPLPSEDTMAMGTEATDEAAAVEAVLTEEAAEAMAADQAAAEDVADQVEALEEAADDAMATDEEASEGDEL